MNEIADSEKQDIQRRIDRFKQEHGLTNVESRITVGVDVGVREVFVEVTTKDRNYWEFV